MAVTVRNVITDERFEVPADSGKTVKQAVAASGRVHGEFTVRDASGAIVDDEPVSDFDGKALDVGLAGQIMPGS